MGAMRTDHDGIEIEYETMGDPADPPLLLIMGLGAQLIAWPDEFCLSMVDRGFFVIRYDNRDTGLSTKVPVAGELDLTAALTELLSGGTPDAPYLLDDMADDAVAVLDALGIGEAHVVGASMGGMIAQCLAIARPERVRTLTSIMSSTGEPELLQPSPEVLAILMETPAEGRDATIAQGVAGSRVIGSPDQFDEEEAAARAAAAYDRCYYPRGIGNQLLAIVASPDRTDGLRRLDVPTLVIHGTADPLVNPDGGRRTAQAVHGAELIMIEGMGHDLPKVFWPQVIEAITALASRSAAAA
jgi:pimeloyl-ACP methyl ester carboxylesterase